MNTRRFTVSDVTNSRFYQLPKFLFDRELNETLNNDAKILYAILKDRHSLSLEKGWVNERGEVYFIYTRKDMEKMLGCSAQTTRNAINQLKVAGLFEEERIGLNRANRLYLMAQSAENTGVSEINTPECQNLTLQSANNDQSGVSEYNTQECQKLAPNKTDINNTDLSKTKSIDTKKSADPCSLAPKSKIIEIGDSTSSDTSASTQTVLSEKEAELFELFIAERKSRGKKTTILQRKSLIQKLFEYGSSSNERTEILEKTIHKGWLDFYPPSHQITPLPSSSISTKTESIDIEPDDPKELLQKLTEKDRASNTFVPFANSYEEENRYGNSCF